MIFDISANHLRAGRSLLGWDIRTLAEKSGVSIQTIQRYEREGPGRQFHNVGAVLKALTENGVEFLPSGVVREPTNPESGAAA